MTDNEGQDRALETLRMTLRAIGDKFDEDCESFELFRRGETVLLHTRDGLGIYGTGEAAAQMAAWSLVEEIEDFLGPDEESR